MIEYLFAMLLLSIGAYCLLFKENLIKKIIGLGIMTDGVHLLLISLGFRKPFLGAVPPILTNEFLSNMNFFTSNAVDALPQALVLTSIVIDISYTALALIISIHAYRVFGTLRANEMREKE